MGQQKRTFVHTIYLHLLRGTPQIEFPLSCMNELYFGRHTCRPIETNLHNCFLPRDFTINVDPTWIMIYMNFIYTVQIVHLVVCINS